MQLLAQDIFAQSAHARPLREYHPRFLSTRNALAIQIRVLLAASSRSRRSADSSSEAARLQRWIRIVPSMRHLRRLQSSRYLPIRPKANKNLLRSARVWDKQAATIRSPALERANGLATILRPAKSLAQFQRARRFRQAQSLCHLRLCLALASSPPPHPEYVALAKHPARPAVCLSETSAAQVDKAAAVSATNALSDPMARKVAVRLGQTARVSMPKQLQAQYCCSGLRGLQPLPGRPAASSLPIPLFRRHHPVQQLMFGHDRPRKARLP